MTTTSDDILLSLDGARDALVTAINNKGGSLSQDSTLYQCADAVGSLSIGTSAEYYKCASVDTSAKTWSGYKAVFDSTAGTWSFSDTVTEGLTYTSVTPVVGGIYSSDALVAVASIYLGYYPTSAPVDPISTTDGDWIIASSGDLNNNTKCIYAFYERTGTSNYCWHSVLGLPQWIQWQNTTTKVLIKSYILTQRGGIGYYSSEWTLSGSNDGVDWVELDSVSLESVTASQVTTRNLTNNTPYYYHRITVTKCDITGTDHGTIGRIQAFNYLQQ